ncbi:MAG: DNA primase [Chitinophaga sp.]|jgi:DNA primase|nr:DNA primase [Chitinophaga sp.]
MITPQTIEQIKSRIDIIDVIGEYVKLKKRGANYLGNCPFHNEKTPSFTVSPAKEIYKCFGCGKSGNTITFLMEHDKLSYVEALKWLANRYGIEIEETEVSPEQKQAALTSESLYVINNFAQKFFEDKLFNSEEGKHVGLSYLKERGFREHIINKFQIGYNPSARDELSKALAQNQFNKELLTKTGLVVVRNENELVDNYRNRIIFPIHNNSGKIIGFGARVIGKADKAPKYINTPENELYNKSKVLYGSYFARMAIDKANECLLVEGYTDVISLHQAGIENVVASGGTSLTTEQLRIIKKYTNNLTIIYDGDSAGVKAALRGLDMAIEEGLNVKLVLIPDNEDPDSYVNKVGTTAFNEFIAANKKDFIIFQLEIMMKDAGGDINKKSEVANAIAATLSKISEPKDLIKRREYTKRCAEILNIAEVDLTNLINYHIKDRIIKENKLPKVNESEFFKDSLNTKNENIFETSINVLLDSNFQEREIVRLLIEYGDLNWDQEKKIHEIIFETLNQFHLSNEDLKKIVEQYEEELNNNLIVTKNFFIYIDDKSLQNLVIGLLYFPFELSFNWSKKIEGLKVQLVKDEKEAVSEGIKWYQAKKLRAMLLEVELDIQKHSHDEKLYLKNIEVHMKLKEVEKDVLKNPKTVIFY